MIDEIENATEETEKALDKFTNVFDRLMSKEKELELSTKKATGRLKDSAQKLSDGLTRIEKQANFDRLERYVTLLERAEQALSILAKLDESGKLEKIAAALK